MKPTNVHARKITTSFVILACLTTTAPGQEPSKHNSDAAAAQSASSPDSLGELSVWDDGLCEMSYYRTTDRIYGTRRSYTRVHCVNRQWLGAKSGVKTNESDGNAIAVLKLNIAEQIPTDNYNYRYLTTAFLRRDTLQPLKMVVSSQEWCGTTFKHLRWLTDAATLTTFSYFGDEGDSVDHFTVDAVPYEALVLIARDVAASGKERKIRVLPPMRSTHKVAPSVIEAVLQPGAAGEVTVAAGSYNARRVDLSWTGPPTGFLVESAPPHRLLRFRMGPVQGELLSTERRAYWDRNWPSSFYETGDAP